MASHREALQTIFAEMREPWWNEDIIEDIDTNTDRRLEAEARRKRQGGTYKTFPNQAFLEILFMMLHGFAMVFVPCYIMLSITLVGWVSSVEAITQDDQAVVPSVFNQTLVGDGGYDMYSIGITYFVFSIFLFLISVVTIKATSKGIARRTKLYLFVNFLGLLLEVFLLIYAQQHAPMKSCQLESLGDRIQFQMKWYGLIRVNMSTTDVELGTKTRYYGYEAILKMNSIQEALGCCGSNGYGDYKQINDNLTWFPDEAQKVGYGLRTDTNSQHRELDSIPHTCCKPVWQENIYCTEGIDEHEDLVKERISANGCYKEAEKVCENILYLINIATFRIILLRLMFFLFAVWMLHYILQLLAWEKIRAFEALLDMQRPNLEGFDLADALAKLKPITSKTQALPYQRMKKISPDKDTNLMRGTRPRNENIWEELQRKQTIRLYKAKTREQVEQFSSLVKDELGEIPAELNLEDEIKHPHSHHPHPHHHHHHHHEEEGQGPKPKLSTLMEAVGRLTHHRRSNKIHSASVVLKEGKYPAKVEGIRTTEKERTQTPYAAHPIDEVEGLTFGSRTILRKGAMEPEIEYEADEEAEAEETTESKPKDRHRYHRYEQRKPTVMTPYRESVYLNEDAKKYQALFDQEDEERKQVERVQAFIAKTMSFDDRESAIITEPAIKLPKTKKVKPGKVSAGPVPSRLLLQEPANKRLRHRKRKAKGKSRSKRKSKTKEETAPKKPRKEPWDDLWWTGH